MRKFDPSDEKLLLAIARRSIERAVGRGAGPAEPAAPVPDTLAKPAAAFVTIHEHGELRGCIGLMRFETPLWLNVKEAAAAAAMDDPRFLPVSEPELPALELEVSVLDPPVEIPGYTGFVAGRHGIIVERGGHRALFLPQVATEMGWNETQMLDAVCRKANLPTDAWRDPATRLLIFESVAFSESGLAAGPAE